MTIVFCPTAKVPRPSYIYSLNCKAAFDLDSIANRSSRSWRLLLSSVNIQSGVHEPSVLQADRGVGNFSPWI